MAEAIQALITALLPRLERDEPIVFHVDKHGGRNTYAALLQNFGVDYFQGNLFSRAEGLYMQGAIEAADEAA